MEWQLVVWLKWEGGGRRRRTLPLETEKNPLMLIDPGFAQKLGTLVLYFLCEETLSPMTDSSSPAFPLHTQRAKNMERVLASGFLGNYQIRHQYKEKCDDRSPHLYLHMPMCFTKVFCYPSSENLSSSYTFKIPWPFLTKMARMNFFPGQEYRLRCTEWMSGHRRGKGGWDELGK